MTIIYMLFPNKYICDKQRTYSTNDSCVAFIFEAYKCVVIFHASAYPFQAAITHIEGSQQAIFTKAHGMLWSVFFCSSEGWSDLIWELGGGCFVYIFNIYILVACDWSVLQKNEKATMNGNPRLEKEKKIHCRCFILRIVKWMYLATLCMKCVNRYNLFGSSEVDCFWASVFIVFGPHHKVCAGRGWGDCANGFAILFE